MNIPKVPPFQSILFVCLGNICRSPLAEGVARHIATQFNLPLRVDSAGTSEWHIHEAPHKNSCAIARQHGFEIDHLRARRVNVYTDDGFDLIIALDQNNYRDLLHFGFAKSKLYKLGDFGFDGDDVPDPYHYQQDGFMRVYQMIESCVYNLLAIHHPEICDRIPAKSNSTL